MRKKQREETSERTEWGGVASAQKLVVETVQENVACLEERERREWALAAAAGRLCAALGALDLAERDRVDLGRVVRKEKVPETGANDEADDDVAVEVPVGAPRGIESASTLRIGNRRETDMARSMTM